MAASAARKAKPDVACLLATELLGIHKKHQAAFARIDAIKAELKQLAADRGENFKEVLLGLGQVSVSRPKPGAVTGQAPELQVAAFHALPEKERKRLTDKGLVAIVDQVTSAYYGAVTVKLF